MKYHLRIVIALFLFAFTWIACKNRRSEDVVRDTTITQKTSFNNLFLDSLSLESFIRQHPAFASFQDQYLSFYKQRNYEYAWFDSAGLSEQSHNFMNLLNSTIAELQDSSLYSRELYELYGKMNDSTSKDVLNRYSVLRAELLLTGQFFTYAAKVYKGSDIDAASLGWFIPRKKVDIAALLDSTIRGKGDDIELYTPLNSQFKKLQQQLVKYNALIKQPFDSIPKVAKPLKKGDSLPVIALIKARLFLLGDLATADSTPVYDSVLFVGVKKFQNRMGLSVDGAIGNKMIEELNVSPQQRMQQILVNMERARWMPAERDTHYIVVNIPEYKMHVYDSGKQLFDMRVIVGTAAHNTVIFNGQLRYIVFSPYWNVPPSIVQKEIMPAMERNANYIQRNNMEITGYSGKVPIVRQKPGPNNSLGRVKFLFPNSYDIYFHDTPNHDLFTQSSRGFSHGCIRLSEPQKMAEHLLRNDKSWNDSLIAKAMDQPKEKWVTLDTKVPVFIVYFTAWVDINGELNFRKDIYGHDKKMADKLFATQ